LILVLAVVFFRWVFAGHVTHITKKIPESQSISVGEASTIRTKQQNMGYTRSTNVFLLAGT
jgi:outer membrane receptor for Fe3+-dicitrate